MATALKQLLALTTITITVKPAQPGDINAGIRPVPPETQDIPMGAQFKARDAEEEAQLIDMGAARPVQEGEVVREADVTVIRTAQETADPEQDRLNNLRRDYYELTGKDADQRLSAAKLQEKVEDLRAKNAGPTGGLPPENV